MKKITIALFAIMMIAGFAMADATDDVTVSVSVSNFLDVTANGQSNNVGGWDLNDNFVGTVDADFTARSNDVWFYGFELLAGSDGYTMASGQGASNVVATPTAGTAISATLGYSFDVGDGAGDKEAYVRCTVSDSAL